ncbi:MAG: hypothetical protein ACKVG9_09555 [Rhodospirillales bacterium]
MADISKNSTSDPIQAMVVDDAAIVRRLISRMLNKDPDITVVASVANGQMAVDSLARSPVGVVV